MNNEEYEKLKSLLYTGELSQYGKRQLIGYIEELQKKNKSLEQENSFLKTLYRNTDEFKAIEKFAKSS